MNLPSFIAKYSRLEMVVVIMSLLYIALPIKTPKELAYCINSTVGLTALFASLLYLCSKCDMYLTALMVYVVYVLVNRSCEASKQVDEVVKVRNTEKAKKAKMVAMNPTKEETLEEEMVDKLAPIGKSDLKTYLMTSYSPVVNDTKGASVV
tara:strand:- start:61 stop:513 length:453 start_codon:yes stop_codon:yes gene_type:complete